MENVITRVEVFTGDPFYTSSFVDVSLGPEFRSSKPYSSDVFTNEDPGPYVKILYHDPKTLVIGCPVGCR